MTSIVFLLCYGSQLLPPTVWLTFEGEKMRSFLFLGKGVNRAFMKLPFPGDTPSCGHHHLLVFEVYICHKSSKQVHYYDKVTDNGCIYRAPLVWLETLFLKDLKCKPFVTVNAAKCQGSKRLTACLGFVWVCCLIYYV